MRPARSGRFPSRAETQRWLFPARPHPCKPIRGCTRRKDLAAVFLTPPAKLSLRPRIFAGSTAKYRDSISPARKPAAPSALHQIVSGRRRSAAGSCTPHRYCGQDRKRRVRFLRRKHSCERQYDSKQHCDHRGERVRRANALSHRNEVFQSRACTTAVHYGASPTNSRGLQHGRQRLSRVMPDSA